MIPVKHCVGENELLRKLACWESFILSGIGRAAPSEIFQRSLKNQAKVLDKARKSSVRDFSAKPEKSSESA